MDVGMNTLVYLCLCLFFLPLLFSCAGEVGPASPFQLKPVDVPVFNSQKVPSSRRSKEVVARVAPTLVSGLKDQSLSYGSPVFIRIFKEERELEVWLRDGARFKLFRTYAVAAMSGQLGPKLREGDRQAPEGFYFVPPSSMNPRSRFHLSFNLGYPNTLERNQGRTGSFLMVHGNCVSTGCYAMGDRQIEEIYLLADAALKAGQPFFRVHCFPFRMHSPRLEKESGNQWHTFWMNLKQGYDHFEKHKRPPKPHVT